MKMLLFKSRHNFTFFPVFLTAIVNNVICIILLSSFAYSLNTQIKVCHNKDCIKRHGGERLLNTFRDLLPPNAGVDIERSGCLSQCGKGPNVVVIGSDKKEKLYVGVDDPTTASAVLDIATGKDYNIGFLLAATYIHDSEKTASSSKKEKLLSKAIEALTKDNDQTLVASFAHAHSLLLRANANIALNNVDCAIDDATLATELAPKEGKAWRALSSAEEASGNILDAIETLKQWAKVDPSFSTKAKKEIIRLTELLE